MYLEKLVCIHTKMYLFPIIFYIIILTNPFANNLNLMERRPTHTYLIVAIKGWFTNNTNFDKKK